MSSRPKLVHAEPVVRNLVCIGQKESRHLPGCGNVGYQLASQVIERMGLLVPCQGLLVQPYPTVYYTLLLQDEFAECHIIHLDRFTSRLVPVRPLGHLLYFLKNWFTKQLPTNMNRDKLLGTTTLFMQCRDIYIELQSFPFAFCPYVRPYVSLFVK